MAVIFKVQLEYIHVLDVVEMVCYNFIVGME